MMQADGFWNLDHMTERGKLEGSADGRISFRAEVVCGVFLCFRNNPSGSGATRPHELGMPVQDAFDTLLIMNLGRLPSWVVLRGL